MSESVSQICRIWSYLCFNSNLLRAFHILSQKCTQQFTHHHLWGLQRMVQGKCLVDVRGQTRMGRLVRDDRKAKITQISTRSTQGMQNTISERTTCGTAKKMGYSSRRPHRVQLLSANSRKLRLQFTQAHQNWTIEDCHCLVWHVSISIAVEFVAERKIPLMRKQTGN